MDNMREKMAYCGLYCGACHSMINYEKQLGDAGAMEMQTDAAEKPCSGCEADAEHPCEFLVCNKNHGTECCAFCPEFPCAMIIEFKDTEWEHHQVVLQNLFRIKEVGVEKWLEEQAEYWQCPACGSRTMWYQRICTKCGGAIERRI
jgi:hypothetical protein